MKDNCTLFKPAFEECLYDTLQGSISIDEGVDERFLSLKRFLFVLLLQPLLLCDLIFEVVNEILKVDELILLQSVENRCELLVLEIGKVFVAILDELLIVKKLSK
jgi:hypothetical protein